MKRINTNNNNDITMTINIIKAYSKHISRNNNDQNSRYDASI